MRLPVLLAAALLVLGGGCSFSYSSKSLSDSSASSSESSSASSQTQVSRYRQDVADYAQAYVTSGGAEAGFLGGIGALAEKRGISDWEAEPNTWVGIGQGLGRANVNEVQLDVYAQNWSAGDAQKLQGIQKGWNQAR
ncbi:MAG: putative lipoprotein [Myxococcota bacterium]